VEVTVPGRKGKAVKKEMIKVKREVASDSTNPFADWKPDARPTDYSQLAICSPLTDIQPSLKSLQLSPFNPPPPHLRQQGHQLYLQITLLEGETLTLVCASRGWYVSKSNVNHFDGSPRAGPDGTPTPPIHSLIDLLHSLSPQFTERLSLLAPISTSAPQYEPISTVPIPQAEPAYSFLAPLPKIAVVGDVLRTQLAYLHTGATTADALDSARDWNEEIQGVKELPHAGVQERVQREKLAQKTWAEFTQASIRSVLTVSVSHLRRSHLLMLTTSAAMFLP
jgi:protein TIF31